MNFNMTLTKDFFQEMKRFPAHVHKKTTHVLSILSENPFDSSLETTKLEQAEQGIHRTKLDDDYRLIWKHIKPNNVVVCFVDKHDDAYRRARRISVTLDKGMVAIKDISQVEVTVREADRGLFSLFNRGKGGKLFREASDRELLALGVMPDLLLSLRAMNELDDLLSIEGAVPVQTWNQLFDLACRSIDRPVVPDTKLDASLRKFNGGEDLVRFVNSDEFRRVLEGTMAEWMLFLSPRQNRLVHANFEGPARVKGVAGSGKTVIAIHRAWLMAQKLIRYPDREKILFLTYGNRLPAVNEELLRQLSNNDPKAQLVKCQTIHSWCGDLLKSNRCRIDAEQANNLLANAVQETQRLFPDLSLWQRPLSFFQDEIRYRIKGRDATKLETYMNLPGTGRGTPLQQTAREAMFAVFQAYDRQMKSTGLWDFDDLILEAWYRADPNANGIRYVGAVVDEIQDLSETTMRLIRKMVIPGSNDLFLVGDGTQRIYKGGYSLKDLDIHVKGRSAVLHQNFRNTKEIMTLATAFIENTTIDDLDDDAEDPPETIFSVRSGEAPVLFQCISPQEEIKQVADEIKALQEKHKYQPCDIAILARLRWPYWDLVQNVLGKSYPIVELNKSADTYFGPGLKFTTLHSAKGLEFKVVFIVGLSDERLPYFHEPITSMSEQEITQHIEEEKRLLYVGMTRARDRLYLTCSPASNLSRFLRELPSDLLVTLD